MRFHARAPPALSHTHPNHAIGTPGQSHIRQCAFKREKCYARTIRTGRVGPHTTGPGVRGALAVEYVTPTEHSLTVCAARDSATGPSQTHDPRAPPKCILLFSAVGTFNCGRSTPQCGCQSMQVHLSRRLGPRRVQSPIRLAHSSGGGSSPSATAAAFFACCASRIAIAPPEGTKTTVDHSL